jgi:hypothetical protein
MQNEALLIKNLHKFFNKDDLPWVQLLWSQYWYCKKRWVLVVKHSQIASQIQRNCTSWVWLWGFYSFLGWQVEWKSLGAYISWVTLLCNKSYNDSKSSNTNGITAGDVSIATINGSIWIVLWVRHMYAILTAESWEWYLDIYLGLKKLFISKSISTSHGNICSAPHIKMDLENKMPNQAQGLLLATSSRHTKH